MRSETTIKQNIAKNITFYRKQNGDTQAGLAEKLNYSDKSISKWERGEGTPDVFVLAQLAELYGISVDELIGQKPVPPKVRRRLSHFLITLMSVALVWLVATVTFFVMQIVGVEDTWLCFIYAIPVSAIVVTVFVSLWGKPLWQCVADSALVWSIAATVHITCAVYTSLEKVYLIYMVAAALQVLMILWFAYLMNQKTIKEFLSRHGMEKK